LFRQNKELIDVVALYQSRWTELNRAYYEALEYRKRYDVLLLEYEALKRRYDEQAEFFNIRLAEYEREMDRHCDFQQREILRLSEALAYEQLECQRHYQEKDMIKYHYQGQFSALSGFRAEMENMFGRLRDGIGRFPDIVDYTSTMHGG
jgi:hypothetical protein